MTENFDAGAGGKPDNEPQQAPQAQPPAAAADSSGAQAAGGGAQPSSESTHEQAREQRPEPAPDDEVTQVYPAFSAGGYPTERIPAAEPYPPASPGSVPPGSVPPVDTGFGPGAGGPSERKPGRAGLIAGAVVLALVAGGVGGAIGSVITHDRDRDTGTSSSLNSGDTGATVPNASGGAVESVAKKVVPSVVKIEVAGNQHEGEGSGEVLTRDGLILTNDHVAVGGGPDGKLTVIFADGSRGTATLVGADSVYDIAVLRVAGKSGLTPIEVGTSQGLHVGQPVIAVGAPLGLESTVTSGIVSFLNRPVATSSESGGAGAVIDAVQTDAAINPGNSGGALVDMSGRLVGVNTAIASLGSAGPDQQSGSIGLGFAIPVDQAKRIADELIRNGRAVHPVIGIMVRGDEGVGGAKVDSVTPGSPAAKAGIPSGALVTKLDSRRIVSNDALVAAVRSHRPGDTVSVTYTEPQSGQTKTVQVTLAGQSDGGR
jgi:putative serine protease PepD